ncbi:hypothetical protein HG535_0C00380 [Zygotorulaspora mrakii]|uniref:VPS9 domain-containing protein n=1 Tax=Zygotorulaspora mrakii TaxID=42260 RepID=A0A7H9B152_ZYGMR|nr:uncharacterized protein HG535_0C00380 [Zygotorulaspora mrakii]QLG71689.1 hypothetical protein HG535_0C00380 [Zygotorulaspora mrakii]
MSRQNDVLKEFDPLQQNTDSEHVVKQTESVGIRVHDKPDCRAQEKSKYDEPDTSGEATSDVETFYDFQLFAKQLQEPSAEPIIKYSKSFLRNFQTQRLLWTAREQQKLINDFKIFIYDKFLEYEPFKSLDAIMLRNAQEGIEKLIMGKLHNKCFSPCLKSLGSNLDEEHKQDLIDDKSLQNKVEEFKFIKPADLDIDDSLSDRLDTFVKFSGKELNKINRFKAPRDKMICILNSCKVIFGILRHHTVEEKGADNFIPILIYTILKNNIQALGSNVKYIERFRYEEFIRGEASYYLNSLQAAINFIVTLEKSSLSTDHDSSFEDRYQENQSTIQQETNDDDKASRDDILSSEDYEHNGALDHQHKRNNKSTLPSDYILHPLDNAANAVMQKFNELLFVSKHENREHSNSGSGSNHPDQLNDNENVEQLAKKLQEQEQRNTLETLQAMFPEMDDAIIEDVCIAKKYRVGATVDVLLSL